MTQSTHPHYLFVYGTLKTPWGNHGLLVRSKAKFIGEARTMEKFTLTEQFPTIWKPPNLRLARLYEKWLGQLKGELYKVTDEGLEACDRLEGHPIHYCRTPTTILFGPDKQEQWITAGIYIYQGGPPNEKTLQRPDKKGKLEWGDTELQIESHPHPQFRRKRN